MNQIRITIMEFEFIQTIDMKQYEHKPLTKTTMRKYDAARYSSMHKEERRYE